MPSRHLASIMDTSCSWKSKRVWRSAAFTFTAIRRLQVIEASMVESDTPRTPGSRRGSIGAQLADDPSVLDHVAVERYQAMIQAISTLHASATACICSSSKRTCSGATSIGFNPELVDYDEVAEILFSVFKDVAVKRGRETSVLMENCDAFEPELMDACSDLCGSASTTARLDLCKALGIHIKASLFGPKHRPKLSMADNLARLCLSSPSEPVSSGLGFGSPLPARGLRSRSDTGEDLIYGPRHGEGDAMRVRASAEATSSQGSTGTFHPPGGGAEVAGGCLRRSSAEGLMTEEEDAQLTLLLRRASDSDIGTPTEEWDTDSHRSSTCGVHAQGDRCVVNHMPVALPGERVDGASDAAGAGEALVKVDVAELNEGILFFDCCKDDSDDRGGLTGKEWTPPVATLAN